MTLQLFLPLSMYRISNPSLKMKELFFGEVKECEHYCYRPDTPVHVSVIIKRQSKGDVSGVARSLETLPRETGALTGSWQSG